MNVYVPSNGPADWQKLLAKPDKHWRAGFSAQAVAQSWEAANGVPPEISNLFGGNLELLFAIPEHQVPLRGGRRPSQCDVFALLRHGDETVAMAVEGKVDEPFGPSLREWIADASSGKLDRLEHIRSILKLEAEIPSDLHYQLLHRTAAAVIEAKRFKTDVAAMIVQSFSPTMKWFDAFAAFASYLGLNLGPGQLGTIRLGDLELRIGWATGDQFFRTEQTTFKPNLYESDFYAWLNDQAVKLRARSHNDIDWDNLAEEIESVGRSQKREIRSRLQKLIHHLLKWEFQPGRRSESWRISIGEQRTFIPGIVEDSPSLKSFPASVFAKTYLDGRRDALNETGLQSHVIPLEPPFTLEEALDYKFLPGEALRNSGRFPRLNGHISATPESNMKLSTNTDFTKLLRAQSLLRAMDAHAFPVPFDIAVLPHDERHLRRRVIELAHGEKLLIDLPEPVTLETGDRLVLDDGRHAEIISGEEELYDIRAKNAVHLTELAWHIGNRHLAAAISTDRILILRDHVIKAMLEGLGATVAEIVEPFEPVRGAYSGQGSHGHEHEHEHEHHGHSHGDHDPHHDHGERDRFGRTPGDPHYGHNHA